MTLAEELRAAAQRQFDKWNGDYHLLMRAAARVEEMERLLEDKQPITVKVVAEIPAEAAVKVEENGNA